MNSLTHQNFELVTFHLSHKVRTCRPMALEDIKVDDLYDDYELPMEVERKAAEDHDGIPKDSLPKVNFKDFPRTIGAILTLLSLSRGASGILLRYCLRDILIPEDWEDDVPSNYQSLDEEAVARAPIAKDNNINYTDAELEALERDGPFDKTFKQDMVKVYLFLKQIFESTEAWVHTKPARKSQNGRLAFRLIRAHYMGHNMLQNQYDAAIQKIESLVFSGESRGYNFRKFAGQHKEQHNIIISLSESPHGTSWNQAPPSEHQKVMWLVRGIKESAGLGHCTAHVLGSNTLKEDFDATVQYINDFMISTKVAAPTRRVAELGTRGGGGRGRSRGGGKGGRGGRGGGNGLTAEGLPVGLTQEEVDAQTHMTADMIRKCPGFKIPEDIYKKYSKAERHRVFQLKQKHGLYKKGNKRGNQDLSRKIAVLETV